MDIVLTDIETAEPDQCREQGELMTMIREHARPSEKGMRLYERFLSDPGIHQRYFAWTELTEVLEETGDERARRYCRSAVDIAVRAFERLLRRSGCEAGDVDAVFIATCTGYLCPGLSSYVAERMNLSENIHMLDIVGSGCAGALAAMRTAEDHLRSHPDSRVVVIAVEICSAAIHWAEEPELILSNAIFGDGAAAALLTNHPGAGGLKLTGMSSLFSPRHRDLLRFKYRDARLCNVISPRIPQLVRDAVERLHARLDPMREETAYAFHCGGRKILDTIQQGLRLTERQMSASRSNLRNYGNVSSPSVLYVLKEILHDEPVGRSVMAFSFGAGLLALAVRGVRV